MCTSGRLRGNSAGENRKPFQITQHIVVADHLKQTQKIFASTA